MSVQELSYRWPYGEAITGGLLEEGQRLGPFVIEARLSITLYGALYRARGRDASYSLLLVLPDLVARNPLFIRRLRGALEVLTTLDHENLLPVRALREDDGRTYIEYAGIEALTLTAYLHERRATTPATESEAKFFVSATAKVLAYVAEKRLQHLSLTPEFVLVTHDGGIRVYGFGLFESLDRRHFEELVSVAIVPLAEDEGLPIVSALDALSPEVQNGLKHDVRSDIYSLGLIAYYILTRSKPVPDWILPSVCRADLSEGWDLFVSHCLEPQPADRYQTLAALLADLVRAESLHQQAKAEGKGILRKLERIPLPESIKRRTSAATQLRLRLLLLAIAGVASVGTMSWWVRALFLSGDEPVESPYHRVPAKYPADLRLRVTPARALLRFQGAGDGERFAIFDGQIDLRVPDGPHSVVVEAPLRAPATFTFDTADGVAEQALRLRPAWTTVTATAPPGTLIVLQGSNGREHVLATVGEEGTVTLKNRVFAGERSLVLRHERYEPVEPRLVKLPVGPFAWDVPMTPLPTTLRFQAEAEGTEVFLQGKRLGTAPLTLQNVPPDTPLTFEVAKPGYRRQTMEVSLLRGESKVLAVPALVRQEAALTITVDPPALRDDPRLALSVAGQELPRPYGPAPVTAPAGEVALEAQHPDYETLRIPLSLPDGGEGRAELKLQPRPARLHLVHAHPGSLKVYVDGVFQQLVGDVALPPGTRQVRVEASGFIPATESFTVAPNEQRTWEPELRPLPPPQFGEPYILPEFDLALAWVPAGSFTMGSPREEEFRLPTEDPRTVVKFAGGFWVAATEVPQRLYEFVMGRNPSRFKNPDNPVDSVSWAEAQEFCRRVGAREAAAGRLPPGFTYRLGTEAEWEYAARAGTLTPFSFGDIANPSLGNFRGQYPRDDSSSAWSSSQSEHYGPKPVGSYAANPWGLFDMHGNVAEWVEDTWRDRLPGGTLDAWPLPPASSRRTIRGGSWSDLAHRNRSAAREGITASTGRETVGFRLFLAPRLAEPE